MESIMVQIKEEDLLREHIICPRTKDIKELLYYQDLGYKLYFMDSLNQIIQLMIKPAPSSFDRMMILRMIYYVCDSLDDVHILDFNKCKYHC